MKGSGAGAGSGYGAETEADIEPEPIDETHGGGLAIPVATAGTRGIKYHVFITC